MMYKKQNKEYAPIYSTEIDGKKGYIRMVWTGPHAGFLYCSCNDYRASRSYGRRGTCAHLQKYEAILERSKDRKNIPNGDKPGTTPR